MGKELERKRGRSRRRAETSSSSSPSSSSSSGGSPVRRKKKSRSSRNSSSSRHRESSSSGRRRHERSHRSSSGKKEKESKKRSRRRHRRRSSSSSSSGDGGDDVPEEQQRGCSDPEALARQVLERFPEVAGDLEQLLQMIDNGQGVDIRGISNKSLVKILEKLFFSLKLEKSEKGVFLLPPVAQHTLDVIGPLLQPHLKSGDNPLPSSGSPIIVESAQSDLDKMRGEADTESTRLPDTDGKNDLSAPSRRRVIGPEMPSRELLAAAAELTEAETLLREADLEADDGLLIGPPPPAMVAEAESANEAERFEEVSRIAGAEVDKPYEVLGVNWKMSSANVKKRYWKLSLLVHPDKCSHPQAQEAFVKLNQAFKDLQDPAKRQAIDEKIKLKEEQEEMKAELQAHREAAQWRRLQGISIEGDEELLAISVTKEAPKRDEWMTTLPPERKQGGMPMQSTSFSRTAKEGRGDTSAWTDNPIDKAEKAKQNYLEAYNKTKALADVEDTRKMSLDADLVDKYNSSKRSKSLVEKHREGARQPPKKNLKKQKRPEKEEWAGQHPWKPWDREKDLTAGRMNANIDSESMGQGLTSRFSGGTVQRNFL
ncbi:uncharacterized protein M6B38_399955 [Iris pallida]|uniref:J domain-containing protein n=1 Tax=Iris pallida TaxID=29817 RepID=A0AAX6FTM4_IRIPA|nr:uncharacterized protein M6B38_399955 [Iris pallida]